MITEAKTSWCHISIVCNTISTTTPKTQHCMCTYHTNNKKTMLVLSVGRQYNKVLLRSVNLHCILAVKHLPTFTIERHGEAFHISKTMVTGLCGKQLLAQYPWELLIDTNAMVTGSSSKYITTLFQGQSDKQTDLSTQHSQDFHSYNYTGYILVWCISK